MKRYIIPGVMMTTSLVPTLEIQKLIQLVLDHFENQYGLVISLSTVNYGFIQPRQDNQLGLELISTSTNDDLAIRVYISFSSDYTTLIDPFGIEQIQNTTQTTQPLYDRYVCIATLPRNEYPNLVKLLFRSPSEGGLIGFNPQAYTVNSGDSVVLTLTNSVVSGFIKSVDYETQDVTALGGIDYISTFGTLTWLVDDASNKTIEIDTGLQYYYYWRPYPTSSGTVTYDYNEITLNETSDGRQFGFTANILGQTNFQSPLFKTSIDLGSSEGFIYHEFEITTLTHPVTNQAVSGILQLDIGSYDQINNFSSNNTNPTSLAIEFEYDTVSNGFRLFGYSTLAQVAATISLPVIINTPFRIGFLINGTNGIKVNINGYWFNPVAIDGSGNAVINRDVTSVTYTPGISGTNNVGSISLATTSFSDGTPATSVCLITAKIGSDQFYRPAGAFNQSVKKSIRGPGTFIVKLSNPSNVVVNNDTATITIAGGDICYTKIITQDSETGFLAADPATMIDSYQSGSCVTLDWNRTTSGCGEVADLRLTATNSLID